MTLLLIAAIMFLTKINSRYGALFRKARLAVTSYMTLFTISFLVRGVCDILVSKDGYEVVLTSAIGLFLFYSFTELIPMFVLYSVHIGQFRPFSKQLIHDKVAD
jgi:hypothetical protein